MHAHAQEATWLTASLTSAELRSNRVLQLAVIRLLEIIGEAAARTPDTIREHYPQLPWRQMSGLRNRLIHDYDTVDLEIVWTILTTDLPPLLLELDAIIREFDSPSE
jgi:uncharacterized protein with HEPN domain